MKPLVIHTVRDMVLKSIQIVLGLFCLNVFFSHSQVVYTNGSDVQVYVRVEKINPELNTYEMTNDFHFIFSTVVDNLPSVMPSDYSGKLS